MAVSRTIIVAGAGIGGLTAALALARQGFRVVVLEKAERLEEAGVSWRVYQNELSVASGLEGEHDAWLANYTDNPLEWFDQYVVGVQKKHRTR